MLGFRLRKNSISLFSALRKNFAFGYIDFRYGISERIFEIFAVLIDLHALAVGKRVFLPVYGIVAEGVEGENFYEFFVLGIYRAAVRSVRGRASAHKRDGKQSGSCKSR